MNNHPSKYMIHAKRNHSKICSLAFMALLAAKSGLGFGFEGETPINPYQNQAQNQVQVFENPQQVPPPNNNAGELLLKQGRENVDQILQKLSPTNGVDFSQYNQLIPDKSFLFDMLTLSTPYTDKLRSYFKQKLQIALEKPDVGLNLTAYDGTNAKEFDSFFEFLLAVFPTPEERNAIGLVISCNTDKSHKGTNDPKLTDTVVIQIIQNFKGVKEIHTCNCSLLLTNAFMEELNQEGKYPNLASFRAIFYKEKSVTDAFLPGNPGCMKRFVEKHPKLKALYLSGPDHVITGGLMDALTNCKALECVYLGYWRDDHLTHVQETDLSKLSQCKKLKAIHIFGAKHFTLEGFKALLVLEDLILIRCNNSPASKKDNKAKIEGIINNHPRPIRVEIDEGVIEKK